MGDSFVAQLNNGAPMNPNNGVMSDLFSQYERVIIESIITSFGLDFLVPDTHGGDVDTIHNVRQIGKDPQMTYKNSKNEAGYPYYFKKRGLPAEVYGSGTGLRSLQ